MPRLNNNLFSLLSLSCYNNIGDGCKSSPLLIVWRDRGELFWNNSSQVCQSLIQQAKKKKRCEKKASILRFHLQYVAWGKRAALAVSLRWPKTLKILSPPLVILAWCWRLCFTLTLVRTPFAWLGKEFLQRPYRQVVAMSNISRANLFYNLKMDSFRYSLQEVLKS